MIFNKTFDLNIHEKGYVSGLYMKNDPHHMNWVIEDAYLEKTGYSDGGKLFGNFDLTVDGKVLTSSEASPRIQEEDGKTAVVYAFAGNTVAVSYDLSREADKLYWKILLKNETENTQYVSDFGVWASLAYVMFREHDVLTNIHHSAAVFPSISTDYTKLNAVRRGNCGGNLGMYQVKGRTQSIGTYCDYVNLFFENVSPSLDGMLYHKLILAGGYPEGFENEDWIYEKGGFSLEAGEDKVWEYVFCVNENREEFLKRGMEFGHAKIEYTPLNIVNETVRLSVELPEGLQIKSAAAVFKQVETGGEANWKRSIDVPFEEKNGRCEIAFRPEAMGEHKIVLQFTDGTEDFVVVNVMDCLDRMIEERAAYICDHLYNGPEGAVPYAFEPVSNQGESLGKLNLVLKKNLLGRLDAEQVRKVEASAVNYVRMKWFEGGDFRKPVKLYGDFYRCMDFEYIGHLFYLLSEFDETILQLNTPGTYLEWAAEVFDLRVNPELHEEERGKEEAQMLGVYFLYFSDLMKKLKAHGFTEKYERITSLWEKVTSRIDSEADTYKAAVTEHFYDNAGFGPTAGALAESGRKQSAQLYGQLLLANIGYSNDFRGQNPDRWWEALTYMIHSLWGGVTAAAAYKVFENLQEPEYLEAAYRATAGILYCYDTHSTATKPLAKGMAASTYAVAGPHLNRPDLSRERFGQSTFFRDGGIFARLFDNDSQTPDWDMGEELVAYLDGFGRKTFVIQEADSVRVINGSYEETAEGYRISSFAPYPEEFWLITENGMQLLEKKAGKKSILLKK